MFGGFSSPKVNTDSIAPSATKPTPRGAKTEPTALKREREGKSTSSDLLKRSSDKRDRNGEKKRRGSSVSKAAAFLTSAKNSLHISHQRESQKQPQVARTPLQILGKMDPALIVPQGALNNSAGESLPTPCSSFRVGVTEDRNRKCRKTMEDTHAYLYNFLGTPVSIIHPSPLPQDDLNEPGDLDSDDLKPMIETDNGYFAIFDGHAGTFAAEWCGKKLHLLLEETIKKNPNLPVPMLLDQTFTLVDQKLEKLPLRNSGCTAVIAVLRWEDRQFNVNSSTPEPSNSAAQSPEPKRVSKVGALQVPNNSTSETQATKDEKTVNNPTPDSPTPRRRVLYTANVGDARIILCRNGKALRLSYDHKGSDENEGMRITNAGGLILNNRVNGVLAVTRALGDSYIKDLVTGHPFTTETMIQPDADEFVILACDGLWDVCSDQDAVDLIRDTQDPQAASKILVDHALSRFSTDNLSCMVVRFDTKAHAAGVNSKPTIQGDISNQGGMSETEKIVARAKKASIHAAVFSPEGTDEETDIAMSIEGEPGPEIVTSDPSRDIADNMLAPVSDIGSPAPDKNGSPKAE